MLVLGEAGKATPPHELGYRYGHAAAFQCLLLRWASLLAPFDAGVLPEIERGASANLPISAADLMPDFMGKALGLRLKLLEDCWIASNFSMTRADLLAHP